MLRSQFMTSRSRPEAYRAIDAAFAEIVATHRGDELPPARRQRCEPVKSRRLLSARADQPTAAPLALCFAKSQRHGVFRDPHLPRSLSWAFYSSPRRSSPPTHRGRGATSKAAGDAVRFRRPLRIDLGGSPRLTPSTARWSSVLQRRCCCVNAGGDLRVVAVSGFASARASARVLALEDGSLASSGDHSADATPSTHVNGISAHWVGARHFCLRPRLRGGLCPHKAGPGARAKWRLALCGFNCCRADIFGRCSSRRSRNTSLHPIAAAALPSSCDLHDRIGVWVTGVLWLLFHYFVVP